MSHLILNSLLTEEHADGKHAWLKRPLMLLSPVLQGIVIVPAGFFTDYTSHPLRTARGEYNRGSVGHDFLYEAQTIVRVPDYRTEPTILPGQTPCIYSVTRAEADAAYLEWLEDLGTGLVQRNIFYAGVRLGGWLPWSREDRSEHRPYDYGVFGDTALPETIFGHRWTVWRKALACYAQSYPRHREF